MIVAVVVRLCVVSSCRISHFGINPVRGGSPPSDINTISTKAVVVGEIIHEVVRSLIVFDEDNISSMNVEVVIKM